MLRPASGVPICHIGLCLDIYKKLVHVHDALYIYTYIYMGGTSSCMGVVHGLIIYIIVLLR
jgi:hypothetical protein